MLYIESETGKKAIEQYQQSAENGDSNAYVRLGQIYESCKRISDDRKCDRDTPLLVIRYPFMDKAIEYYKKACDMGNPNGYYALWWLSYDFYSVYKRYISSRYKPLRIEKIFKSYGAHHNRFKRYNKEEDNINKYAQKALSLYRNMEHNNDGEIYYKMGVLYEFAMNDMDKANEYYKKAYLNGSVNGYEVYYRIGEYYKIFEQKYGYGLDIIRL